MNQNLKLALFSMAGALTLLFGAAQASAQRSSGSGPVLATPKVTTVTLGSPYGSGAPNGGCPQNITISGSITVSGKCTVKYAWIQSDIAAAPTYFTLTFDGAGTKQVMIQFGASAQDAVRQGQLTLKVIEPNVIQSQPYNYNISCSDIKVAPFGMKP